MVTTTAATGFDKPESEIISQLAGQGVQSCFTSVGGLRTHYFAAGLDQPTVPIILLHGMAMSGEYWVNNLAALAAEHPVYAPSLWGHGWSQGQPLLRHTLANNVAFVHRFLREVGVSRANVVGHSMGGQIAARFAIDQPGLVNRLILADAAGLKRSEPILLAILNTFRDGDMRNAAYRKLVQRLTAQSWAVQKQGETVRMVIGDTLDREIERIVAPTLLIWGRHDRLVPLRYSQQWLRGIAGSRLVVLDSSHTVMYYKAAEFNRLVLDFCQPSSS